MKLGIVGGGAMGEAIIAAVTGAKVAAPSDVRVNEIVPARRDYLQKTYGVQPTATPAEAVSDNDLVLIALKPQECDKPAPGIGAALGSAPAVSIMAGVTLGQLSRGLSSARVVRAMPNPPAQIGEGMTAWTATAGVSEA